MRPFARDVPVFDNDARWEYFGVVEEEEPSGLTLTLPQVQLG